MAEQWRAQHAPGGRMVLVGPACAVLLPAEVGARLAEGLWPTVQSEPSPVALVNTLTGAGLDSLHDFAMLVRDGDRIRCLVRGDVRVSDLDSGEVLADGDGLLTWREASLRDVRAVRLGVEDEPARLPLLLGAAMVNHVDISFDGSDPVARPESPETAVASQPASDAVPAPAAELVEAPEPEPTPEPEPAPEPEPTPAAEPVAAPEAEAAPEPVEDEQPVEEALPEPFVAPVPAAAPLPPVEGAQVPLSPSDHDGLTIFQRDIAATHKPSEERATQVLAAMCAQGHPNPPGSQSCRLCGAPVAVGAPQIVSRPPLGLLVASSGDSVELDGQVLIGRAPSADGYGPGVRLLTVPSPNQDISRTHLLVGPDGWAIEATDLESTNGTLLLRPGQDAIRLAPSQPVMVQIGDVLDLGDGVSLEIVNPTL